MRHFLLLALYFSAYSVCLFASVLHAAEAETDSLAARWRFSTEETSPLEPHGGVYRDQAGPRPPEFPDFDPHNTAVRFAGDGAHYSYADPGEDSAFDFRNGDAITLEAWVNVEEINPGEFRYVIGKGRTGAAGFARDNQNWALRVLERDGAIHTSFLFATKPLKNSPKKDAHWHRWSSQTGFLPGSGWHHIAVSYKFGEPESIRGWLDGVKQAGNWDMGGPTTEPPVVDDDAIWIASSMNGNPGSSFRGRLDEIAVYRAALSDETMKARYRREGPERPTLASKEVAPQWGDIPAGRVSLQFHEGLAAHNRWPQEQESLSPSVVAWDHEQFYLPRLPYRYDTFGVRDSWNPPVLVRMGADIALPAGKHRFVIRARGLSRLWVNEKVIARTKPHGGSTDGHEPVAPLPQPPLPGLYAVAYGDQEAFGELDLTSPATCRVIFEAVAGGKALRAEPGEMLVAVQTAGSPTFVVLAPAEQSSPPTKLIESEVKQLRKRTENSLTSLDDRTRRASNQTQRAFWEQRHRLAKQLADMHPAPAVPTGAKHPIDAFLIAKMDAAKAAHSGESKVDAVKFHSEVLPILRDHCFRCHGEKVKGGLRLHTREAAMQAGETGEPAVVPGKPAASQLLVRVKATEESERMPPTGDPLQPQQIAILEAWVAAGAVWPPPPVTPEEVTPAPLLSDASFLRRVYLDTVGVAPNEGDVRSFLTNQASNKREAVIERLLADDRFADHWVSYWQDVLAENPNILKPSLNNSGPFRFYLYESLRDNKPFDQWVTDLIMLRGSEREGGAAGFGLAADNDAPFAAKGHILAGAFLGVELQCARCHDSPYHSTKQKDLYALSAMLARKAVTVPKTSTVSPGFFDKNKGRESLIKVTLKPGEPVPPRWPFDDTVVKLAPSDLQQLIRKTDDTREQLAAYLTAPHNERFAQVTVNRIWKRLLGAGIVEPAFDWEGRVASHPELLQWLAHDFVAHGYDLKHVVKRILTSEVYQRQGTGRNLAAAPEKRFFNAPERRRLTAEQVVDSLFAALETPIEVEEITFDPEGKRPANTMINLGVPSRAWMFTSLSNERDRPSLSLPRAQMVIDVLEAFGWTATRQNPRTDRETEPTVLQPGVLANSVMVSWLTRASYESRLAQLAVEAKSPEELIDTLFLRILSRSPSAEEKTILVNALSIGFADRLIPPEEVKLPEPPTRLGRVSWSNHLVSEANSIKIEMERRARSGSPPDPRLRTSWRETYEDAVWSIMNTPEFVWMP